MGSRPLMPGEAIARLRTAGITIIKERTGDGTEIRCRCPRHRDPDGHLYANAVTGAAFCQKCGLSTHINAFCGHEMPTAEVGDPRYEILAATATYYDSCLSDEARHYLIEERRLLPEVLDQFRVGWADGGLRRNLLDEKGFASEACVKAGVLKQDERGLRDFFYQRIIFPNIVGGRVVHLSGRVLGDGKPKWCHLPGDIIYPYNADALRQLDCLWVEGILDVLSAACWDMPAVAGLGTHAKPEWIRMVPDGNRITVSLDSDAAGSSGSLKVAELLGDRVRIASLPAGMDPNDMLREGRRAEFESCLQAAVDLLTFRISQIPVDTPRTELRRLLTDALNQIAERDAATGEAYLGVIKARFHLRREEVSAYRQTLRVLRKDTRDSAEGAPGEDTVYSAQFDGLVDVVEYEGEPAFLVLTGNGLQIMTRAERDGQILLPPPKGQIQWLLPPADEALRHYAADSDGQLWNDLVAYHRGVSELPSDAHYEFIATWVMHTYLLEGMHYSPQLCLFAVPERGKTRTGSAIVHVAYRGIHVESLREAYLLRFAAHCGGTVFFDVRALWRKAEREGSEDIVLCRFERGITVPRVIYPDRGPHQDTVYYPIFGPTIIGTNEPIHHILETRAVTITMPDATRSFEDDVTPEAGRTLRARLVAFRARHIGKPLPDVSKPTGGRLGDILRPLRQILRLVRSDRENAFLAFVADLRRERLQGKSETLEAALLRVIHELRDEPRDGLLPVRLVTEKLNEGRLDKDRVSDQKVGWRLRSLGFQKGQRQETGATIQWDGNKLTRTMVAYGLQETTDSTDSASSAPEQVSIPVETVESAESGQDVEESGARIPPSARGCDPQPDESAPKPTRPCYTCHGTRFWLDTLDVWKCGTCHPPASEGLVAGWRQAGEKSDGDDASQDAPAQASPASPSSSDDDGAFQEAPARSSSPSLAVSDDDDDDVWEGE